MLKNLISLFKSTDQLGLSFIILQLIHKVFKGFGDGKSLDLFARKDLQKTVYALLPKQWKSPEGKLSELEFIDIIDDGMVFYQAISKAFK